MRRCGSPCVRTLWAGRSWQQAPETRSPLCRPAGQAPAHAAPDRRTAPPVPGCCAFGQPSAGRFCPPASGTRTAPECSPQPLSNRCTRRHRRKRSPPCAVSRCQTAPCAGQGAAAKAFPVRCPPFPLPPEGQPPWGRPQHASCHAPSAGCGCAGTSPGSPDAVPLCCKENRRPAAPAGLASPRD